jgi:hypothetical protein
MGAQVRMWKNRFAGATKMPQMQGEVYKKKFLNLSFFSL